MVLKIVIVGAFIYLVVVLIVVFGGSNDKPDRKATTNDDIIKKGNDDITEVGQTLGIEIKTNGQGRYDIDRIADMVKTIEQVKKDMSKREKKEKIKHYASKIIRQQDVDFNKYINVLQLKSK